MKYYEILSLENLPNERWKDIDGYEGMFQVSDYGRIKSLSRACRKKLRHNPITYTKDKIRKQQLNHRGYCIIGLKKNGGCKHFTIGRLVAKAFIPNPHNKPFVNHLDCDTSNNHFSNLEWCTQSENIKYAYDLGRKVASPNVFISKFGKENPTSKPVLQLSKDGCVVKEWDCIKDVERQLGFWSANISHCARGLSKTAYGFVWKFKNEAA